MAKARRLKDVSFYTAAASAAGNVACSDKTASTSLGAALPSWIKDRMDKGDVLPVVNVEKGEDGGRGEDKVMDYVLGDMKEESFRDLVDLLA